MFVNHQIQKEASIQPIIQQWPSNFIAADTEPCDDSIPEKNNPSYIKLMKEHLRFRRLNDIKHGVKIDLWLKAEGG